MHPSLSHLYHLKTADCFFPEEPERLMGPLNEADDLESQCKLMQKDIAKAEVTAAEVEIFGSPRRPRRLGMKKAREREKEVLQ